MTLSQSRFLVDYCALEVWETATFESSMASMSLL